MPTPPFAGESLGLCPGDYPEELALPTIPARTYRTLEKQPDEWEAKVGVNALDAELDLYRQHSEYMAPLAAIFDGGQNPLADGMRKQHRAWVAGELLTTGTLGEKVSEAALERIANADPRHLRYAAAIRRLEDAYNRLWRDRRALERMLAERDHRIGTYNTELRNTR